MQVRNKRARKFWQRETCDSISKDERRASHDSWPEVHEVRLIVNDDRYRWSGSIGIGIRSSGTEKNYLGL